MHLIYLFNKIVDKYPNHTALRFNNERQSYSELNQTSNNLYCYLQNRNIKPGSRVGLSFNDPLLFINSMLALVKLNAIYVPFDKKDNDHNIAELCEIAGVSFFLHDNINLDPILDKFNPIIIEREILLHSEITVEPVLSDKQLDPVLYIMFTSSTTGKAKGVLINHSGISRFISENNLIKILPGDTLLQGSSISFDASSFEIWSSLLNGATLVLIKKDFDFLNIGSCISQYNINILWLTTKLFETLLLVDISAFEKLKYLIFGGESCNHNLIINAFQKLPGVKLINGYGPTENTIFTTLHLVTKNDEKRGFIPIGFPVNGTECFILDEHLNEVSEGNIGLLYVSGAGIAHSYTDKDLTASNFITHPTLGSKIYNTKDLVKYSQEFGFEFIGRKDRQIKLNGYRIELDLIENIANKIENVSNSISVFIPSTISDELVLFYTTTTKKPLEIPFIKKFLESNLPWYSLPKTILFLEEFPLNNANKIDQKKLVELLHSRKEKETTSANIIEKIWKDILQLENIHPDDNFFNIGGDSLTSIVLIFKINNELNLNLKTSYIIENPVFKYFSSNLLQKDYSQNEIVLLKDGKLDCPIFLIPVLGGGSEMYLALVKKLKTKQAVFSFNMQFDFDYEIGNYHIINAKLIDKLSKLFTSFIVKSGISPKIILAGFSLGGNIALETSFELQKNGITVTQIHLLDSYKFGNTVSSTISEMRFKLAYFRKSLAYLKFCILYRDKKVFKQLINFLYQPEINPKKITKIPVYLYKCTIITKSSPDFSDKESLDWNKTIERLNIIPINSDHDFMLKEENVEELANKMDESIDELLNELDFKILEFDTLSKADLDYYLSKGWFRLRFGNHLFTDTKAPFDNNYYPVKWLRYKLDATFLRESIKKEKKFNQKRIFTPIIVDFNYENEKHKLEPLYAKYRSNLNFDAYTSVYSAVHHGEADTSIFNSKLLMLYDNDKLIGAFIFDIGEISGAGIIYFFDPEYSRYGIGKYLVLLVLKYLVDNNFSYYYAGFIFIGHSKLNYKLSVKKSGIEYYDIKSGNWLNWMTE